MPNLVLFFGLYLYWKYTTSYCHSCRSSKYSPSTHSCQACWCRNSTVINHTDIQMASHRNNTGAPSLIHSAYNWKSYAACCGFLCVLCVLLISSFMRFYHLLYAFVKQKWKLLTYLLTYCSGLESLVMVSVVSSLWSWSNDLQTFPSFPSLTCSCVQEFIVRRQTAVAAAIRLMQYAVAAFFIVPQRRRLTDAISLWLATQQQPSKTIAGQRVHRANS